MLAEHPPALAMSEPENLLFNDMEGARAARRRAGGILENPRYKEPNSPETRGRAAVQPDKLFRALNIRFSAPFFA